MHQILIRVQKRELLFTSNHKNRFRLLHSKRNIHTKLLIDGEIVENRQSLLDAWSWHFKNLTKSRKDRLPLLQKLDSHVQHLDVQSCQNEVLILGVPVTMERVCNALQKLKRVQVQTTLWPSIF